MEDSKLVSMANQIAAFFSAYPDADAEVALRDHIKLFWTPGMRRQLEARVGENTEGIDRLVVQAFSAHAAPPSGTSPIKKQASGPATLGELASDAG
jgi:formate dehydrogenase subunit delta